MIFDVRSHHYYENWRLAGGEHMPDASQFDPERLATQNISSVAFYCWNDPWESEPAAQWFAQQYGSQGVQVYDIKGLSYLDDVPGMCQYIDGDDEAIAHFSPHCADEGGVGTRSGANRCNYGGPKHNAEERETIVLDPKVLVAVILCAVGVLAVIIVACYMCTREAPEPSTLNAGDKLDDPWATQAKVTDADYDDCELCKAGLTAVVPAGPVMGLPDSTYPPNLPGTPDSNDDESSVGAHGLAVTRWESSDEDGGTQAETGSPELQARPTTAATTEAVATRAPSP